MLLSIVIPCLNEERTVVKVVREAFNAAKKAKLSSFEIIVADNGSTDGSIEKLKKQRIAKIIKVPIKGYGAALHWGILKARGKYILYGDADLSYRFNQLKRFVELIKIKKKKPYDLVLGSRFSGQIKNQAMPWLHRYLGTPVLTFLIRLIYQLPTTDCNSGMRLVRKDFYKSLEMRNSGMEWASELLIKTALVKGHYAEVPITLYPDQRDRPPHLASWADGWRHLKAIVLLKPNLLFVFTLGFLILAILNISKRKDLAIVLFLIAVTFFFATLAAKLIKQALDNKHSLVCDLLIKLPLVPVAICLSIAGVFQFLIFAGQFLIMKMIVLHVILIYDIWIFFIETIKTHLVNRLPRSIRNYQ